MKTIFLTLLIIPILGIGQTIENIDFVSPFHDGLSAVKKEITGHLLTKTAL